MVVWYLLYIGIVAHSKTMSTSDRNDERRQQQEEEEEEEPRNTGISNANRNVSSRRDPYSVLNLSKNATELDIQRAYKRGSRALHPDKQAAFSSSVAGSAMSEAAVQEAFVTFKDSCESIAR